MKVRIAAALGQAALLATALAVAGGGSAVAQTPPAPKAPPAAAPKGPAAPGGQQAQPKGPQQQAPAGTASGAPEMPPVTYSPWTKVCVKQADINGCFTGKDGRFDNGMMVVGATLLEPEGSPVKGLRITLPLGVLLAQGTRLVIDQGQPLTAQYSICFPTGCVAEYEVSGELLGKLHKGQTMVVQGIMAPNQLISFSVPLADFGKAYDGPPTPQDVIEKREKEMQEKFRQKYEAQQQQQQQQQQAPK
jgi:invasion protein IalB